MKTKNGCSSAMTRTQILVAIGIASLAVYFLVSRIKQEETFSLNWPKRVSKTNLVSEPLQEYETHLNPPPQRPIEAEPVAAPPVLLAQTPAREKTPTGEELPQQSPVTRLDDPRKRAVRVPTNAVWVPPAQRRKPGVPIAFP